MARPRSEEAREAALTATVDLVLSLGVEGVTFEAVASQSGVAKTTLYRHFGSKQAMVAAAAQSCFVEIATPDTGDLFEDLRLIFNRFHQAEDEAQLPSLIPALITASGTDPELADLVDEMLEERRRPIRTVLRLAQLREEIAPDLDLDIAVSLLVGPFIQRKMIDRKPVTPEFREAVLNTVVPGLRAAVRTAVATA